MAVADQFTLGGRFTAKTPWGQAQTYENLCQGIFHVTTAGHGGYFVPTEYLHNIPQEQQEWAAKWSGSRHWYEEDCCWAAVCVAFPDLFPADALPLAQAMIAEYCPPCPRGWDHV